MSNGVAGRRVEILLVEDNAGDVELAQEGLRECKINNNLHVVGDGLEASAFLHRRGPYASRPRPDIIILDLNLPKRDGRDLLREIKEDDDLKQIPVVILTTSSAEEDILRTYSLHANCYVTKPLGIDQFLEVVRSIEDFWFTIVKLPRR
jgi:two-component system, chemotaxis family, response regulator Rcp1